MLLYGMMKMVWIMLDATCYNRETDVGSAAKLAKKLGMPARGLQRAVQELITMGFITKDGSEYSLQVEPREDAESAGVRKERRLTNDEKLRLELKDIWNKHKPKNAPSMQDFTPARLKTLRVYAERFKVDEQVVLRKVLDGSNADEFRRDKSWDFGNIFGNGVPTEDKQGKVEKVYKLGCSKKGTAASFSVDDDQSWLNWFHSKNKPEFKSVKRLTMERSDAWKHQVEHDGDGVIYIYHDAERYLVHWTYKENSVGVSYLPTAK